jgi:prolipoprotein diacylglyceryltransferase
MTLELTCSKQLTSSPNIYTLISVIAFIICLLITRKIYKEQNLDEKANLYLVLMWIYPFFIIGSKAFSAFYYNLILPNSVTNVLSAGMSIHGALLASIIGLWIIKKIYKINILQLASVLLTPLGIGIFFIRIANTLNCELIGLASRENSFFDILYLGKSLIPRFPIQLVEGVLFLLLSILLIIYRNKLVVSGNTMKIFAVVFPIIRIITDRFKITPENMIENSVFLKSDFLSAIFLIIAISLFLQCKPRYQH